MMHVDDMNNRDEIFESVKDFFEELIDDGCDDDNGFVISYDNGQRFRITVIITELDPE